MGNALEIHAVNLLIPPVLKYLASSCYSIFLLLSNYYFLAMRKILIVCLVIFHQVLAAQIYQLEFGNEDFTPLSAPLIPVDWPIDWDDESAIIPLGFSFPVGGVFYDSLFLSSNGWAVSTDETHEFNAYYVDLIAAGDETSVSYKTEIVSSENVLKIEFLNAGFYEDTSGTARTSFQFWFYESGCWESRIGPSTIVDTFMIFEQYPGPFIGYANYSVDSVLALIGPSNSPQLLALDSIAFPSLSNVPNAGMFYTFCTEANPASTLQPLKTASQLFPNPASEFTVLYHDAIGDWKLIDFSGRVIKSGTKRESTAIIDVSDLPQGVYLLTLNKQHYQKLVID